MFSEKSVFWVIGGDDRMLSVAQWLKANGFQVLLSGMEKRKDVTENLPFDVASAQADIAILPIPVTRDQIFLNAPSAAKEIKLKELFENLKGKKVFGGGYHAPQGLDYIDVLDEEWLTVHNAELTAEGAILTAMQNCRRSLSDQKILIVGHGRIGKQLAHQLSAFSSNVWVSARKEKDRAEIETAGQRFLYTDEIAQRVGEFDLIFSTVPARIFGEPELKAARPGALLIDLASAPGSVVSDFHAPQITLIPALSLPGKCFPQTAGRLLCEQILQTCREEEI